MAQTAAGYSVYPFSGAVVAAVAPLLGDLKRSKGAIAFTDAHPMPREAFDELVRIRRQFLPSRHGGGDPRQTCGRRRIDVRASYRRRMTSDGCVDLCVRRV